MIEQLTKPMAQSDLKCQLIMKALVLAVCLASFAITITNTYGVEEDEWSLWSTRTQGGSTNVWAISIKHAEKLPPWNAGVEEPPVSLGKGASLAKAWIFSKGADTNSYVEKIEIRLLNSDDPHDPRSPLHSVHSVYFYLIRFGGVGHFGHHMTCVVLMDGTVVEPKRQKNGHPIIYED